MKTLSLDGQEADGSGARHRKRLAPGAADLRMSMPPSQTSRTLTRANSRELMQTSVN